MHELSTRATNLSLHVHGLHAKMESTQDQLKLHRGQMAQWEEQKAHYLKCNATLDKLIQVVSAPRKLPQQFGRHLRGFAPLPQAQTAKG